MINFKILCIEDEDGDYRKIANMLKNEVLTLFHTLLEKFTPGIKSISFDIERLTTYKEYEQWEKNALKESKNKNCLFCIIDLFIPVDKDKNPNVVHGLQTFNRFLKNFPSIPVLILSAYLDNTHINQYLEN